MKKENIKTAEMRPVSKEDIEIFNTHGELKFLFNKKWCTTELSEQDRKNGHPKIGDMIARNPEKRDQQWLVTEKELKEGFKDITDLKTSTKEYEKAAKRKLRMLAANLLRIFALGLTVGLFLFISMPLMCLLGTKKPYVKIRLFLDSIFFNIETLKYYKP